MSCIFCRIVAGEIPGEIVASDRFAVAFLDLHPLADGHTLVVPRTHVATLEGLSSADVAGLFDLVARVARPAREAVGAVGTTIGINNGPATGQTVPHVHVHVVPRWPDDGAGSIHTLFRAGPRRPVAEVGAAIRKALAE